MAAIRTDGDNHFKNYGNHRNNRLNPEEWLNDTRMDEPSWIQRYEYEANLINSICKEKNYKKILEIGPGPGVLSQIILKNDPELNYTLIDKIHAKNIFEDRKYKGNFIVKDLMDSFDIDGLDTDYDLIIANDFLEHIANPSDVLYKATLITKEESSFFISVPNWRMGHDFIYRGLFDYDNFIYFSTTHGWPPSSVIGSPLKCSYTPKLSSEEEMPDELVQSWNWYFCTDKKID
jgi:2-polyprenyl-3-methyl-5-hydroxy-6-metoxy-1,4-benzoquinol methylase